MPPKLLTYADAAKYLDPGGTLSERSIRTEIDKGRLQRIVIAGKNFVTEEALDKLVEAATIPKEEDATESFAGASRGARNLSPRASCEATARALIERSKKKR